MYTCIKLSDCTCFLVYFLKLINLFILLYNIVLVLSYIDLNQPWIYMCSPSWSHLPPPSPAHPSGSSQYTSPEHPVSCIEPGLVIHFTYDNLHISMPFSHIILPSPSRTESRRLFNTSGSLLLSCIQGYWVENFERAPEFQVYQFCSAFFHCTSHWQLYSRIQEAKILILESPLWPTKPWVITYLY